MAEIPFVDVYQEGEDIVHAAYDSAVREIKKELFG